MGATIQPGLNQPDSEYCGSGRSLLWWWPVGLIIGIFVLFLAVSTVAWVFGPHPLLAPGPHFWFFGPVFPFGFLLFVLFCFFLFRISWGWGPRWRYRHYYQGHGARDILEQRFARGEITSEQFRQMKRDLDESR